MKIHHRLLVLVFLLSCGPKVKKDIRVLNKAIKASSDAKVKKTSSIKKEIKQEIIVKSGIPLNLIYQDEKLDKKIIPNVLEKLSDKNITVDNLWGLSNCDCDHELVSTIHKNLQFALGVVPMILIPDIREAVYKDPQVKTLLSLPGPLKALGEMFSTDADFDNKIRANLKIKLLNSLPGSKPAKWQDPTFDMFKSVQYSKERPRTFKFNEQVAKWNLIWSQKNMWDSEEPLVGDSHLTQMTQVVLSLAEWKFMFGLDSSSYNKKVYGGLAQDARVGINSPLKKYDPRLKDSIEGFFSSNYQFKYQRTASHLDIAIEGNSTWIHTIKGDKVTLLEQARLWSTAAKAYKVLKPSSQAKVLKLFDPKLGLLPNNSHQISMAFLDSLSAMLKKSFIDIEALSIKNYAYLPDLDLETKKVVNSSLAELNSIGVLIEAVNNWLEEFKTVGDDKLSEDLLKTINSAKVDLKNVLRLSIQKILLNYIDVKNNKVHLVNNKKLKLVSKNGSIAKLAETLVAMINTSSSHLKSEFLNSKIEDLCESFFRYDASILWNNTRNIPLNPEDIFWTSTLVKTVLENKILPKDESTLLKFQKLLNEYL